ncbi:MAG: DUF2752 domain-containing protein [Alloprevotella sp.]
MQFLRKYLWVVLGGLLLLIGVGLYCLDPVTFPFMPQCPFRLLTGWSCPGCGLQRAIHATLHGRFAEAYAYNLFFVISIPYATGLVWGRCGYPRRLRPWLQRRLEHPYTVYAYLLLFCIWWIVRNVLGI